MKYKIGDKVRVKPLLTEEMFGRVDLYDEMDKYAGKITKVKEIIYETSPVTYLLEIDKSTFFWTEESLCPPDLNVGDMVQIDFSTPSNYKNCAVHGMHQYHGKNFTIKNRVCSCGSNSCSKGYFLEDDEGFSSEYVWSETLLTLVKRPYEQKCKFNIGDKVKLKKEITQEHLRSLFVPYDIKKIRNDVFTITNINSESFLQISSKVPYWWDRYWFEKVDSCPGIEDDIGIMKEREVFQELLQAKINKVIYNDPATILFYETKDGRKEKVVSKCHPNDTYIHSQGVKACILKAIKKEAEIALSNL